MPRSETSSMSSPDKTTAELSSNAAVSAYSPDNHGVLLYTYSKDPSSDQKLTTNSMGQPLGSYGEQPRAVMSATTEDEEQYFFAHNKSTRSYGTKTATGNSRIFNCKHCQRAFTREEHLTRHILLTHNKLKPYVCGICTRPFSRRDLLLRHAKNLHDGSEMAVLRIRKLFKKLDKEGSDDGTGEPGQHGNAQRMKMSVNMLVS